MRRDALRKDHPISASKALAFETYKTTNDYISKIFHSSKPLSLQERELKGEINKWHNGELHCLVSEYPGGYSEYLLSHPLGTKFVGEGCWGPGIDFDPEVDNKIVLIVEGITLVRVCDLFMYLLDLSEGLIQPSNSFDDDQDITQISVELFYFSNSIEDSVALGYDLVSFMEGHSNDYFSVKSLLFLSEKKDESFFNSAICNKLS